MVPLGSSRLLSLVLNAASSFMNLILVASFRLLGRDAWDGDFRGRMVGMEICLAFLDVGSASLALAL
jgi:hypothetical protein